MSPDSPPESYCLRIPALSTHFHHVTSRCPPVLRKVRCIGSDERDAGEGKVTKKRCLVGQARWGTSARLGKLPVYRLGLFEYMVTAEGGSSL